MSNNGYLGLRKKIVVLFAISVALLFVSSATAVPQVNGSIVVEKIDKVTKIETIFKTLSEEIKEILDKNDITDADAILETNNNGNGILLKVFTKILDFLKTFAQGAIGLIEGLFRFIGSLLTIILLIFARLQSTLIIAGFYMIYSGIMSKIGIKILSFLSAPLRAIFSSKLTIAIGELLGYLSVIFHDILAVLIVLAIPLLIVAVVLLLLSEEGVLQDLSDTISSLIQEKSKPIKNSSNGILYMMASCLACYLGKNR
jgi:hypothetical protein